MNESEKPYFVINPKGDVTHKASSFTPNHSSRLALISIINSREVLLEI